MKGGNRRATTRPDPARGRHQADYTITTRVDLRDGIPTVHQLTTRLCEERTGECLDPSTCRGGAASTVGWVARQPAMPSSWAPETCRSARFEVALVMPMAGVLVGDRLRIGRSISRRLRPTFSRPLGRLGPGRDEHDLPLNTALQKHFLGLARLLKRQSTGNDRVQPAGLEVV